MPIDPPKLEDVFNPEPPPTSTAKPSGSRGKASGKPKSTPEQKKLKSDFRFDDDSKPTFHDGEPFTDGEPRKNFSTKIYPALQNKVEGIVLLSKTTGMPRGAKTVVGVIQEALARYIETIEKEDDLKIPRPYGT